MNNSNTANATRNPEPTKNTERPANDVDWRDRQIFITQFEGDGRNCLPTGAHAFTWAELPELYRWLASQGRGKPKAGEGYCIFATLKPGTPESIAAITSKIVNPDSPAYADVIERARKARLIIAEHGYRNGAHVSAVTAIGIDYDGLPEQQPDWRPDAWPSAVFGHSTHNWAPDQPGKWRAILPLLEPLPYGEYSRVKQALAPLLPAGAIVRDATQPAYFPTCPAERDVQFASVDGEPLDWRKLLADAPATSAAQGSAGPLPALTSLSAGLADKLVAALAADWSERGTWSDTALALGGTLRRAGVTREDTAAVMTAAARGFGSTDVAGRVKDALAAWDRADAGGIARGRTALLGYLREGGPNVQAVLDEIERIEAERRRAAREAEAAELSAACRPAPGEVLPDVEIRTYPHAEQQRLFRQLNDRHCVLNAVGGKVRVLSWRVGHHGAAEPVLQTAEDFRARYAGLYVQTADDKRTEVARAWLASPHRRRASTLTFRPDAEPGAIVDGDLNLWQGYAVEPKPGDCSLFMAFVRDIVCSGDASLFAYVWRWLAWSAQNPGKRAEVALALRGGKGTGKNTLLDTIRDLFGAHGRSVSNAKHLTGNFNRHLADCAFLVIDEALAVADKQAEAVLKTLITGSTLQIERKGFDLESATNCLTLAFASNDEWFVPASADERRFCVVDVSAERQQDKAYFGAIHAELANGGRAALLHALLSEPLGDWHPRDNVPQTAALRDQQSTGLRGCARLVYEYLATGRLTSAAWADAPGSIIVQPGLIMRNEPAHRLRGVNEVQLGKELAKCGAERKRARSGSAARSWQRVLPPLAEARAAWASAHGLSGLVWEPLEGWEVDGPPQVSASAAAAAEVN